MAATVQGNVILQNTDSQQGNVILQDAGFQQDVGFFLIDRQAEGLSPQTVYFYRRELSFFADFLLAQLPPVKDTGKILTVHIRAYLLELGKRRNAGGVHCGFRSIRVFFNWYAREFEPENWKNPILKVTPPKLSKAVIPGVPLADVKRMVDTTPSTEAGKRNKVILLALLDTGARASELCQMQVSDLNIQDGSIIIRHGKGDKRRMVFVGKKALREVIKYLRSRGTLKPGDPLFLGMDGEPMTRNTLDDIIRLAAHRAGLKEIPSAHDFRRACALAMLRNGVNLITVSRYLGHATLTVTQRYLALIDDDLQAAHAMGSPVDRGL